MPALAAGMKEVVDEGDWLATQSSASANELESRFARAVGEGHLLVLAEDGGRVVGCTGIHPTKVAGVWSLGAWVLADHRRGGLGREMLAAALDLARERGVRKVELEVFTDNLAARSLYESCGFEVEGLRRDHYERASGEVKSAVVMATFP